MYRILLFFIFTTIILLKTETSDAQFLKIAMSDGSFQTGELATIRKLTFADNVLLVNYKNGSQDLYMIAEINKLFFGEVTTSVLQPDNYDGLITVYPNPVSNKLFFKNLPSDDVSVLVYRFDGVLMIQKILTDINDGIDVSHFSPGMYLVKANNQTTKFIKR